MKKISDLTLAEASIVTGGTMNEGESIVDYLSRMYPFGEWVDGSFYPNGYNPRSAPVCSQF